MIEGHGYIDPKATPGVLARCCGPAICSTCQEELAAAWERCAVTVEKDEKPKLVLVAHLLRYSRPPQRAWMPHSGIGLWQITRALTDWLCIHASDIGADGLPLVTLGHPTIGGEGMTATGIARTMEQAYLAASFRALAIEAKRKAGK